MMVCEQRLTSPSDLTDRRFAPSPSQVSAGLEFLEPISQVLVFWSERGRSF